jgi:succinyl-CoA synthetase beta subunit
MKIHEYQAKDLFKTYGISIPRGKLLGSPEEIVEYVREAAGNPLVIKAQIHAGARGRAGGIQIVGTVEEVRVAARLLGSRLVTSQTGAEGKPVRMVLAEEVIPVEREFYLGVAIDRPRNCISVLASREGGMEIEKVASLNPDKIITENVDPGVGLRPFQAARIFYALELPPFLQHDLSEVIFGLYRLFVEKDCSLAEINPLVLTKSATLVALDGKIDFDDNALFRHPDILAKRDISQENPLEVEAARYHLNYIKLSGRVGCMVNGAGLAMATMDLIKHAGSEPANFLDVGGGATSEMVRRGLGILLSDPDVKVVFINIFGGILRCDTLANGVVEAAHELEIRVPIVIRLEGTNVEEGRRILSESGLAFQVASDMREAAEHIRALSV